MCYIAFIYIIFLNHSRVSCKQNTLFNNCTSSICAFCQSCKSCIGIHSSLQSSTFLRVKVRKSIITITWLLCKISHYSVSIIRAMGLPLLWCGNIPIFNFEIFFSFKWSSTSSNSNHPPFSSLISNRHATHIHTSILLALEHLEPFCVSPLSGYLLSALI